MIRMPLHQRGLTMVELLVALALSTVIALAAVAALVVSRRGFTSVDAASELRDNARFASSMIQRVTAQAGFLDYRFAMVNRRDGDLADPPPNITGFNNAAIATPIASTANGNRSGACNTVAGGGCSDILIVRYQAQSLPGAAPAGSPPVTPSDEAMIDCSGAPVVEAPENRDDKSISVFHVATYQGDPTLMCTSGQQRVDAAGALTTTWAAAVPIASNIENFQVLYGADGVVPGVAPVATSGDRVPDRYLRADQLTVASNAVATNQNWRRVRSVRIGMVLRGPVGSQQGSDTPMLFPFGLAKESGSGTAGYAMSSTADDGTRYTPLADNRMRQAVSFTVYLHNDQGLCEGKTCTVQ